MPLLGFLHTGSSQRRQFASLAESLAPAEPHVHLIDESLLVDAQRRGGVDPDLEWRIEDRLDELVRSGVDVIVCTCSTIGLRAQLLGASVPVVPVEATVGSMWPDDAQARRSIADAIAVADTVIGSGR